MISQLAQVPEPRQYLCALEMKMELFTYGIYGFLFDLALTRFQHSLQEHLVYSAIYVRRIA